ncbi:MAG: hypothetical protein ACYTG6_02090, partial [Planctomycetota bacterium]
MLRVSLIALFLLAALPMVLGGPAAAEDALAKRLVDLPKPEQKALIEAARNYFDPEIEFLWRPRKEFKALLDALSEHEIDPYVDLTFLKDVIYQGRHFLEPFTDKDWQRANSAKYKKTGIYQNITSEVLRFTFTEAKGYPSPSQMRWIPRHDPYPLLISLHESDDCNEDHWGAAALDRRFPRNDSRELYETWMTLAPWAARAIFLEEDNSIRHNFFTKVLTEFWKRYHVDYDRIILDGKDAAATIASAQPFLYAGLILRGGEVEAELVPNFAHLPVYVVGDEALKGAL